MEVIDTKNFGAIPYLPEAVLEFPAGLPGFEQVRRFLPVRLPETEPLIFLQSLDRPEICFITLPAKAVDPDYRLEMTDADAERIGFKRARRTAAAPEPLCLAIVSVKEAGPTANLLAPVVINPANNRAVQAIAPGSDYSWEHPLEPAEAPTCS